MIQLTADESRVLGVLVEKAQTTPEQYPLSMNAIVNGSNQKNNRDPVLSLTEDQCFDAVEALRRQGLVVRVDTPGGRTHKYRHNAIDVLKVRTGELVILAELLLRGPSTLGEIRGRASRMHPMETLDAVKDLIRALTERPEPLVKQLPPSPGSRAERYVQLLCPELHGAEAGESDLALEDQQEPLQPGLSDRVTKLEAEVESLRAALRKLAAGIGEADPLGGNPNGESMANAE